MAKSKISKVLDVFKLSDPSDDEFEDDLFEDDEDDYDDDYAKPAKASKTRFKPTKTVAPKKATVEEDDYDDDDYDDDDYDSSYNDIKKSKIRPAKSTSKLVPLNNRNVRSSQVYVIRPTDFNDAQDVADGLKSGRPTVINMEGMGVEEAQRIIDFIGGACYALDGSLKAISGNIFIASPNSVEVSGDLREELSEYSSLPPNLGRF